MIFTMNTVTAFEPPIREVIVFRPETFPLYRWDNSSPDAPPRRSVKAKKLSSDALPKMPFRRCHTSSVADEILRASRTRLFSASGNSNDASPRCPGRRHSETSTEASHHMKSPAFLASQSIGPCRRPPERSLGYHHNLEHQQSRKDLHQIPLKLISFDGNEIKDGIAQVLQEVVMDRRCCAQVSVVFAIRRPGCGSCREHGMQLGEMVKEKPNVSITGVIKETAGIHKSLRDFYTNYFNFPLYLDEGWDLFHTIGNKKLSIFKLCSKAPGLEIKYAKKGIRNIPLGGDLFTQGGVLIFDRNGKLKFVYYESYGTPLNMEAISWAIDEANKPTSVCC